MIIGVGMIIECLTLYHRNEREHKNIRKYQYLTAYPWPCTNEITQYVNQV